MVWKNKKPFSANITEGNGSKLPYSMEAYSKVKIDEDW